jgi:hypothetical protein
MTAEIAVLTKEAVVLASDSAVTHPVKDAEKIYTSANKLFALSRWNPVGIMFYNNAMFMGVPWETIVKMCRRQLAQKGFATLREYADYFISFISGDDLHLADYAEDEYMQNFINACFQRIASIINSEVETAVHEQNQDEEKAIREIAGEVIIEINKELFSEPSEDIIPKGTCRNVMRRHKDLIDESIANFLKEFQQPKRKSAELRKILSHTFCKLIVDEISSGIVIAGFGEEELFPSLLSFRVEGLVGGKLKYKVHHDTSIPRDTEASLISFAQSDMVTLFMDGIDPMYTEATKGNISERFNLYAESIVGLLGRYSDDEKHSIIEQLHTVSTDLTQQFMDDMDKITKEVYNAPIIDVLSSLPKEELAVIAESLVHLTSLKRKLSLESETVAGPIDVAVISKGDGFIWIKRKHYFKPDLNRDFFSRQNMETLLEE